MNEFKRMVIKVSDVTTEVATIPTTNDHTDGSWLATDIYVGELFLNITDDVLQTRTDAGIITLNSGGGGGSSSWGSITGTLSSQTDLNTALDNTTLIATLTEGASRSLVITDRNKNIENDNSITITVPLNSSVAFPIGTQIFFTKKFETLTIAGAGGVTVNSVGGLLELGRLNCGASLLKVDSDEWNLIGELV